MTNPIPRFSGAPVVEGVSADVVIVGSGVVGGLAAHALATLGHSVILLDAGPRIDRVEAVERFRASPTKGSNAPYENPWYAPQPDDADGLLVHLGLVVVPAASRRLACEFPLQGIQIHFRSVVLQLASNLGLLGFRASAAHGVTPLRWFLGGLRIEAASYLFTIFSCRTL